MGANKGRPYTGQHHPPRFTLSLALSPQGRGDQTPREDVAR